MGKGLSDSAPKRRARLTSRQRRRRSLLLRITLCGAGVFLLAFGTLTRVKRPVKGSFPMTQEEIEEESEVPTGISALIHSVSGATKASRHSLSAETLIVGEKRTGAVRRIPLFNVSYTLESQIREYSGIARALSRNSSLMSDYDYEVLCQIVEAEAGTEDLLGRILVANVIMNRVRNPEFPNNVADVVFQYENGVPQFSPVEDGRIYEVTISSLTREAVKQVLEGVDRSSGALFFIQKDAAEAHSIAWFEQSLKFLFRHGVHEFYTYP